jgi:hypothetical protein
MDNLVDFNEFKKKKENRSLEFDGPFEKEETHIDLNERIERIKSAINRINTLMAELKKIDKN